MRKGTEIENNSPCVYFRPARPVPDPVGTILVELLSGNVAAVNAQRGVDTGTALRSCASFFLCLLKKSFQNPRIIKRAEHSFRAS